MSKITYNTEDLKKIESFHTLRGTYCKTVSCSFYKVTSTVLNSCMTVYKCKHNSVAFNVAKELCKYISESLNAYTRV